MCALRKGDPPINLSWLRDGLPLSLDGSGDVQIRTLDQYSSSLVVSHADARHSGNYTCLAKNAAYTDSHSAALIIKGKSL